MFDFRIIDTADGNQIIDRNLKTPYNALTPLQMVEYTEMDNKLVYMDRMKWKARVKEKQRRKLERNPFRKFIHIYNGLYRRKYDRRTT